MSHALMFRAHVLVLQLLNTQEVPVCFAFQLLEKSDKRLFGINSGTLCSNWSQNVDKYIYLLFSPLLWGINLAFIHILLQKK